MSYVGKQSFLLKQEFNLIFIERQFMIKYIKTFQSIGVDSSIDIATSQRIRIGNTMSIVGISTAFLVLSISYLMNWSSISILLFAVAFILTLIPPILNSFKKTELGRMSFLIIAYGSTLIFSLIFGLDVHFHYFLFALIGLPFIFFDKKFGNKRLLLSITGLIFYIYTKCHFYFFEPIIQLNPSYLEVIAFINDLFVGIMIFVQIYFFVNENDKYIEEITMKSNELKIKNTQLERFAYITSHDLKEPMRVVNCFIGVIKEEYKAKSDNNLKTYFAHIDQSLNRMREMVNGLLRYSQIGKSNNFRTVNLNRLITTVETDLSLLIKDHKATIQYNELPAINGLKLEIKQLFQNLIANAIKFHLPNTPPLITLSCRKIPNFWEFCITDNGIGIPENKCQEIFQMYSKLHIPTEYKGYGIGLAFCQKIVEIHNGKIWVESAIGKGSKFYFTITR